MAAGILEADDADLAQQLQAAESRRRRAEEEIGLLEAQRQDAAPQAITSAKVARLGEAIRAALRDGTPDFRRAWIRLFVGNVIVSDSEIRISGPTAALARAAAENAAENLEARSSLFHRVWRRKGN